LARAVYRAAVKPAGPEPMMTTFSCFIYAISTQERLLIVSIRGSFEDSNQGFEFGCATIALAEMFFNMWKNRSSIFASPYHIHILINRYVALIT
jgi:hypothetical protein